MEVFRPKGHGIYLICTRASCRGKRDVSSVEQPAVGELRSRIDARDELPAPAPEPAASGHGQIASQASSGLLTCRACTLTYARHLIDEHGICADCR